jgi:anti-anti-sigma regulatory factor
MRLNLVGSAPHASAARLVVTGVIDWSTIGQFRLGLAEYLLHPRPEVLLDFTGLLSWSPQAQATLAGAIWTVRLRGGRLRIIGLQPIPSWQAKDSGLPGLDRRPQVAPAAWHTADPDARASRGTVNAS